MPFHAAARRCYIPQDVARRAGLDPAAYARRRDTPALRTAAEVLAEATAAHLGAARRNANGIPRRALAALLPAGGARADAFAIHCFS